MVDPPQGTGAALLQQRWGGSPLPTPSHGAAAGGGLPPPDQTGLLLQLWGGHPPSCCVHHWLQDKNGLNFFRASRGDQMTGEWMLRGQLLRCVNRCEQPQPSCGPQRGLQDWRHMDSMSCQPSCLAQRISACRVPRRPWPENFLACCLSKQMTQIEQLSYWHILTKKQPTHNMCDKSINVEINCSRAQFNF